MIFFLKLLFLVQDEELETIPDVVFTVTDKKK